MQGPPIISGTRKNGKAHKYEDKCTIMNKMPTFHRLVFGLAGFSVFTTGIFYLLAGFIYAFFSFRVFQLATIIGDPFDILLAGLTLFVGCVIYLSLGIFHGYISLKFSPEEREIWESEIWQAYSKLIYLDSVMCFIFGLLIFIGFGMIFTSLDSMGIVNETADSIFSALMVASAPLIISILFVFVANGLSNENIGGAIGLFFRNAGRMIVIIWGVSFVLSNVMIYDLPIIITLIFCWAVIDGISHMFASGILIHSSYTGAKISNYQLDLSDDDFVNHYPVLELTTIPLKGNHEEIKPGIEWQGEFGDDGYEWIEHPKQSDSWFWRDPDTGDWVKY